MRTFVIALACLGIVAGGCGGSKAPSIASLGTTTAPASGTSTSNSTKPDAGAFASCMTSHGFPVAVAAASSHGLHVGGMTFTGDVDPSSPQFQAAMQACRKYMPGGGPPTLTPAQQAEWNKAMAQFGACMRRSGVPSFQNPQFGKGPNSNGIDPGSPLVQRAFKACESLEPKVGPRIAF